MLALASKLSVRARPLPPGNHRLQSKFASWNKTCSIRPAAAPLLRLKRPQPSGHTSNSHVPFLRDAPVADGTARILVVEDDESSRTSLSRYLEKHGFRARGANDGTEAIDLLVGG